MRNVLITGGTGKIGSELVYNMISDKHSVVLTSRSKGRTDKLIEKNRLDRTRCFGMEVDFNLLEDYKGWASSIPIEIDAVIHNARTLDHLIPDKEGRMSANQIQMEYFMAVTMPYLLTYALIDTGHKLKDIIFISSMYGVVVPNPVLYDNFDQKSPINYGSAKAAQIHLKNWLFGYAGER